MSHCRISVPLLILLVIGVLVGFVVVAEGQVDGGERPPVPPAVEPEFTMPEGGGTRDLSIFIQAMLQRRPRGETREELLDNYKKGLYVADRAAEKLYRMSLAEGPQGVSTAERAANYHAQAMEKLGQVGDETAIARRRDFAEIIAKDPREEVATRGERMLFELKFEFSPDTDPAMLRGLAAELKDRFGQGEITLQDSFFLTASLERFEEAGKAAGQFDLAIDLYRYFGQRLKGEPSGTVFEGSARRLELPSNPIQLAGKFLDGEKLDWSTYRGKVVLVDFRHPANSDPELANILEQYEKYHDRGFEVLSIWMIGSREMADECVQKNKLPWKVLFERPPDGWWHPMVNRYGARPSTAILVNRQGNVVALYARGPELGRLLDKLLLGGPGR